METPHSALTAARRRAAHRMLALMAALAVATAVSAQVFSVKNNLIYDATLTPNIGAELKVGRRTTVQAFYGLNPWSYGNAKQLKHWSVMPEYRFWTREAFRGTFWGIHALGGEYNAGGVGPWHYLRHNHLEGEYYGGGLTLGHAWRIDRRWNLEAALGLGYAHTRYDRYSQADICRQLSTEHRNYVGPTKLALNLGYLIGPLPRPAEPELLPPPYVPQFVMAMIEPKAENKVRHLSGRAFIDFVVNQTIIERDYRGNAKELDSVVNTISVVRSDPNTTINHVSIHGYASPEGSYANNTRLANGRAAAFKDYVRSLIQLPDSIFSVEATPEDWDGLRRQLPLHEGVKNKAAILRIANDSTDTDLDHREARIRTQFPADYQLMLHDIYPALRHSDYEVTYTIRSFTVEEARLLFASKPQMLSLNELYLLAVNTPKDTDLYNDILLTAVRLYPDDPTACLNAAVLALQTGDLHTAERMLQKADPTPEALVAQGVLAAKKGDPALAMQLFRQADTPEARHNMQELERAFE